MQRLADASGDAIDATVCIDERIADHSFATFIGHAQAVQISDPSRLSLGKA